MKKIVLVVASIIIFSALVVSLVYVVNREEVKNVAPAQREAVTSPLLTAEMRELLQGITEAPDLGVFPDPGDVSPSQNKEQLLEAYEEAIEAFDDPLVPYDIIQFATEVKAKLGKFESFSVFQSGSAIIPITLDGVEIASGDHVVNGKCDKPPWLGLGSDGQAIPYSRVGRLKALKSDGSDNPDVDWCFIARRYKIRTDPAFPKFEDVAIIGHNRVTGHTAFFQMLSTNDPKDATDVPSPMADDDATKTRAKAFWLEPRRTAGIGCNNCHDADPWIHSPYIDQVKFTEPSGAVVPMVPRGANLAAIPPYNPPYKLEWSQAFTPTALPKPWTEPEQFKPAGNNCVKCHRIGDKKLGSDRFIAYSFGQLSPNGQSTTFSNYPHSHSMPPEIDPGEPEAALNAIYLDSVNQLRSLIGNQGSAGAEQPVSIP